MNAEQLLIILRDCFTGGYTLPQFCVDNDIRKPLFVAEKKFWQFVWEIYVQFMWEKSFCPHFAITDSPAGSANFSPEGTLLRDLNFYNVNQINVKAHDKIFFFTSGRLNMKLDNAIYLDELVDVFVKRTYVEIPLLSFLQRHPKVKLFLTKIPNKIGRYPEGEHFGKTLTETGLLSRQIQNNTGQAIPTPLDKFGYNNRDVYNLINVVINGVRENLDGSTTINDTDEPLIRIQNGRRVTANQPEKFLHRIFFVGACHYMGSYAPFDKTIESYLQKLLNENDRPYRVENAGQNYSGRYQDIFYNLESLDVKP